MNLGTKKKEFLVKHALNLMKEVNQDGIYLRFNWDHADWTWSFRLSYEDTDLSDFLV